MEGKGCWVWLGAWTAAWQERVGGGLGDGKEGTHGGRLGSVGSMDGGLAGTH